MYRQGRMEQILEEVKNSSGLFGADDENQDDQLQGGEESEEDENDSDEQDENDEQDDSQDDDPTAGLKAKNSQLILAKKDLKQKLREANVKIQKLEAGAEQDEDEDKDSDSKVDKRDQTISAQSETIRSLQLQVAFLSDNTHSWNDPKLAISLIDMDDLDIEEDGSISGLKEALDDLAKNRPYLVKTPEKQQRRKSGDQQQRKSDSATKAAERSKLRSKYNI